MISWIAATFRFEWIELRDDKAAREIGVSDGRQFEAAWPTAC